MKVRYDVSKFEFMVGHMDPGMRFTDQREAFCLAKKIAAQDGLSVMERLEWDDRGFITKKVCFIHADGRIQHVK